MRPSDHHITPLPSTVNPEHAASDVEEWTNPQLKNRGAMWGVIELHPPALPPTGAAGASRRRFSRIGGGRWGAAGDQTMGARDV